MTETETIGEEYSVQHDMSLVQRGVIVQQLTIPSSLKCLQDDIATRKLLARVSKKHTPVVKNNQIIYKVDERDFPVVGQSPRNENVDLFGGSVDCEESETTVCSEEEVRGGRMELETQDSPTVVLGIRSTW